MAPTTPPATPASDPTDAAPSCGGPADHPCRRAVLRGAAVLGATGLLAACGGGDDSEEATADSGSDAGGDSGSSGGGGKTLGPASEVPVGGGKIYQEAKVVVTQPSMGEYKAFSAVCTHEKCVVSAVTSTIDCACHGSKYSISDGSVKAPPATKGLESKTVSLVDGNLTLA